MAEELKREFELLALKIRLETSARQVFIHFALEKHVAGTYKRVEENRMPAEDIGLPDRLNRRQTMYHGYDFSLPYHIIDWLKYCMAEYNPEELPLWLHQVRPYGYLGMVPWERLMQKELGVAILRVPEFLADPPRENPLSLDVVLCNSMPVAKEKDPFENIEHLMTIISRILDAVPRRTTIHAFVDRFTYEIIVNQMQDQFNESVHLYNPETASTYSIPEATLRIGERTGWIENPWLLWMRDSLQGTSIDVVHFLTHGYLSSDRGALALAESPLENEDRRMARFVGAAELTTFFTQIGAWSSIFSSPEHNYSEMGLRQLADSIAQMRPGPVAHHEINQDIDATAIGQLYDFLFGSAGCSPPMTPALFMYCHPSRLGTALATKKEKRPTIAPEQKTGLDEVEMSKYSLEIEHEPLEIELELEPYESIILGMEDQPNWITAAERFIEQQNFDLHKMNQQTDFSTSKEEAQTVKETLREIENIMLSFNDRLEQK